jgi:hypothetical protein
VKKLLAYCKCHFCIIISRKCVTLVVRRGTEGREGGGVKCWKWFPYMGICKEPVSLKFRNSKMELWNDFSLISYKHKFLIKWRRTYLCAWLNTATFLPQTKNESAVKNTQPTVMLILHIISRKCVTCGGEEREGGRAEKGVGYSADNDFHIWASVVNLPHRSFVTLKWSFKIIFDSFFTNINFNKIEDNLFMCLLKY